MLAANGIVAWLFPDVHPVPMLSYAVRRLGTVAGIMITASHNPKEYNGYKVYGEDGAQMSPEPTAEVVGYIQKITDYFSVREAQGSKLIKKVPASVDKSYYKKLTKLTLSPEAVKKEGKTLKLVYTPVHGSGYVPVTTILKKMKINVTVVPEQVKKDTEFSTVEVPNPEFKETLSMGIALAEKIHATSCSAPTPTPTVWALPSRTTRASSSHSRATRSASCCSTISSPASRRRTSSPPTASSSRVS